MADTSHALAWKKEGDVTVIRFRMSSITESQYLDQACEDLRKLASKVGKKVLFSLGNVDAISSRAIAALVSFNRQVRRHKGHFKICELRPFVSHVLHVTNLDKTLEIHGSKAEAMAAFRDLQ